MTKEVVISHHIYELDLQVVGRRMLFSTKPTILEAFVETCILVVCSTFGGTFLLKLKFDGTILKKNHATFQSIEYRGKLVYTFTPACLIFAKLNN